MTNMNELLASSFGEQSNRLTISFKKTVSLGQYQTETVQADAEVIFDNKDGMTAIERETINNVLMCTTEYSVISHIYLKGQMSQQEFLDRRKKLECSAEAMLKKYEALTGKSRDTIINKINTETEETDQ